MLFDPNQGVLVIEVKGGDIWCEHGEWHQRNRKTGAVLPIWPEVQASNTCHRIREELHARIPRASTFLYCYAVWFPEGMPDRQRLPMNCPSEIVFDEEHLSHPESGIQRAFAYWHSVYPNRRTIGTDDAQAILALLAPTLSLVPSVQRSLDEREQQLVQLTNEQAKVLDFLDEQRKVAIHGAAGTGKTLVAIEKARRLASATEPVLFLCYNSALRKHLQMYHDYPNVHFATFHGFARELFGQTGTLDEVEQVLLTHLIDNRPLPYSHLIVDEAQDFKADWLEYLSLRFRNSTFYVFYDRNQFVQGGNIEWLEAIPCRLVLTRNCRNTNEVARVAYRAAGIVVSPTLGVSGPRPVLHNVDSNFEAAALAQRLLEEIRANTKLAPHDLAILTLDSYDENSVFHSISPKRLRLSADPKDGYVTMTTTRRFKGLEASVVIVPDVDLQQAHDPNWRRRLYVACSRARQAVHLITAVTEADIGPAVRTFSGSDRARPTWRSLSRHLGLQLAKGGKHVPFK